jgi:hypothetical protein
VILLCQWFNEDNFDFLNSTNLFRNTYSKSCGQKRYKARLSKCLWESGKGVRPGYVFRAGSGRMSGLFASNLNITRKFNYKGSHSPGFDESTAQKTGKNEPKENKKRKNTYNNEYEVFT